MRHGIGARQPASVGPESVAEPLPNATCAPRIRSRFGSPASGHVHACVQHPGDGDAGVARNVEDHVRLTFVTSDARRDLVGPAAEHRVLPEMLEAGMQAVQVFPRQRHPGLFD